jgi:hypothetical protein
MNRRDFLSSMFAAMVAAPTVVKAASQSTAWADAAIWTDVRPDMWSDAGVIQMSGPTEASINQMMNRFRICDIRWLSFQRAQELGRYKKGSYASDGSQLPLRFNDENVYIEPMISVPPQMEAEQWEFIMNPEWENARYEIAVTPDTRYPHLYHKDVARMPDYWAGRLVRANQLHASSRPSAIYFER